MAFDFSRISKTNLENSVEFVQGHFLNHPAYFFSKTDHLYIDRHFVLGAEMYPAHCTSLELLHESPQNKLCYRLHPKYTGFSCFPIICSLESFYEIRLTPFLISWRKLTKCYSKFLPTTSATYRLFSRTFYESISIHLSKKVYQKSSFST